jgi:hypothetical protein
MHGFDLDSWDSRWDAILHQDHLRPSETAETTGERRAPCLRSADQGFLSCRTRAGTNPPDSFCFCRWSSRATLALAAAIRRLLRSVSLLMKPEVLRRTATDSGPVRVREDFLYSFEKRMTNRSAENPSRSTFG